MAVAAYFARHAQLPDGPATNVRIEVDDGRFVAVVPDTEPSSAAPLPGVVLPGLANCHSHAFHRALRARTHDRGGTFWTWRERMYALAAHLDPDTYLALARATYAEMALAGFTCVGEFHYLHHAPGGRPYADPNEMGEALRMAAADAGVRLTLLDACYLSGGLGADGPLPLDDVQRRFADADVYAWADRMTELPQTAGLRAGAAVHSVRAVPEEALRAVADVASGLPVHAHVSEQPAENEACEAFYGLSPTLLLSEHGLLGRRTTAVHATHLSVGDIALLGKTASTACFCPTTERDLADGIGPARSLAHAGATLSLGTDQHVSIDPFAEAQALEGHERLASLRRGVFTPTKLLDALTRHDSLGWPDAGRIEVGARADLVAVRDDSARTAGSDPTQILYSAAAADVDTVLVDGRAVVNGGQHVLGAVGPMLQDAIATAWEQVDR